MHFAITKKNLLSSEPKLVIIIDCGETSLQITYAAVWDAGVKVGKIFIRMFLFF